VFFTVLVSAGLVVSVRVMASTRALAPTLLATQSKRMPRIAAVGIVGPVENVRINVVLSALLWRSAIPGSMVIVYAVLGLKPRFGEMEM
jgi:hypothetical protein